MTEPPRLGKLLPMYDFVLNPYADARFTRCPGCEQKMRQRKLPLFIHVEPLHPVVLGYTCRYCPDCDLLIAHQDEIEGLLANLFAGLDPSVVGNDYLVLGTVERKPWRESLKQPKSMGEMLEYLHDFKEVRTVEYQPAGWYKDEALAEKPTPSKKQDRKHKRKRRKRR